MVRKPLVAELKAAQIYFKEPAKRETRRLTAHSTSDAIILKHETLVRIFHVQGNGFCATDMRLRRSGSLKGAPVVESLSCYRNFSKCKYAEMQNGPLIWQGQNTNREAGRRMGK